MPVKVTDPAVLAQLNGQSGSQMPQIGSPILTVPGSTAKQTEADVAAATAPSKITEANANAAKATQDVQDAQQKAADEAKKDKLRTAEKILDTDTVLRAIKSAKDDAGEWTTGLTGKLLSYVPSVLGMKNDAYNLEQDLNTVAGNIAFDKYTQLKENMPEGAQGGIRLTENELNLLKNLQGSINQGLDPKTLGDHLDNLDQRYRVDAALHMGLDPSDADVMKTFGIKAPPKGSLRDRLQPAKPASKGWGTATVVGH